MYIVKVCKETVTQWQAYLEDNTSVETPHGTVAVFQGKLTSDLAFGYYGTIEVVDTTKGLKYDGGKLRYDLVLPEFEDGVVSILTMGAEKYEPNSWQSIEEAEERYYAALRRHLSDYRKGETLDPESGQSHLLHAACNLMFLHYFEQQKNQPTQG